MKVIVREVGDCAALVRSAQADQSCAVERKGKCVAEHGREVRRVANGATRERRSRSSPPAATPP